MHSFFGPSILLTLSVATSAVSGAALHNVHHHRRALTCYEDNTLRALERFSSDAAAYCPKFLQSSAQQAPANLANIGAAQMSSACACFAKTAAAANPASTPANTPTSAPAVVPATTSAAVAPTSSTTNIGTIVHGNSYNGGKRGLVYDYHSQDFSRFFRDSGKIAFGSDWDKWPSPAPGVTLDVGHFVPTIRVDGGLNNDGWANQVNGLLNSGTQMIFASNEPDNAGQANLRPDQAATVWRKFLQPFQGRAALASPAITNGGGATGLGWLENFVNNCQDCRFDIINVHHYVNRNELSVDQAVSAVKSYLSNDVTNFMNRHPQQFSGARICLGEFWLWGASDADGAAYLRQLLPWLDSNPAVACYQAFGGLWQGNFINGAGNGLTQSGQVYHDL
ncbi:MAG: hypothetical protein LQ350_002549 [Teloschistes chrysophthalmus]|nr:MAG: hypothetical protein LQ350_002549 [Niorma chrysophthalma]